MALGMNKFLLFNYSAKSNFLQYSIHNWFARFYPSLKYNSKQSSHIQRETIIYPKSKAPVCLHPAKDRTTPLKGSTVVKTTVMTPETVIARAA